MNKHQQRMKSKAAAAVQRFLINEAFKPFDIEQQPAKAVYYNGQKLEMTQYGSTVAFAVPQTITERLEQ